MADKIAKHRSDQGSPEKPGANLPDAPATGKAVRDFFSLEEIFRRVLATAEEELEKPVRLLFWSGLAAGLALGLTFLARVVFSSLVPTDESGLIGNLFYPIGFMLIVLGRYQLFTENTLTPVTLVLTRFASLWSLLRLWGIVFFANMLGAVLVALLLATTGILEPAAVTVGLELGHQALDVDWWNLFFKALIAGWLVASMVWLVHSARDTISRVAFVWLIMYFVGAAELFHCITSSVEVFFLAFHGETTFWHLLPQFIAPITLGNTVGGVLFVAILNYAQIDRRLFDAYGRRLSWRRWLSGKR